MSSPSTGDVVRVLHKYPDEAERGRVVASTCNLPQHLIFGKVLYFVKLQRCCGWYTADELEVIDDD